MEKYKVLENGYLGYGSLGDVWLVENEETKELFAMKWYERGPKEIDEKVVREIIIHKSLCHPNIIQFKEVVLSSHCLGIVMEYAEGGDLHDKIFKNWPKKRPDEFTKGKKKGLGEDLARYFFQQLMSGVYYCHSMDVCHRNLKPENILLDGSDPPRLKISCFGYSKSYRLHSKPNSAVGTPLYMAPEVCSREYNGKLADVWSCGMILYTMLVGDYPMITRETSNEENACPFYIPRFLSAGSKDVLTRMLVENPEERITIEEIMEHQWYKEELPGNLAEATLVTEENPSFSLQRNEEIWKIVEAAKISPPEEDVEFEEEEEDEY
ncbi:hypothetical protein SO802_000366 [Lithocarpus litseifolius]|uniref:non-specific serine/threonine protein kinase n=1 Tax=Lithocarpus litseifolius TaxID=425828 RepID=A0AAW2DRE0_9ROSI